MNFFKLSEQCSRMMSSVSYNEEGKFNTFTYYRHSILFTNTHSYQLIFPIHNLTHILPSITPIPTSTCMVPRILHRHKIRNYHYSTVRILQRPSNLHVELMVSLVILLSLNTFIYCIAREVVLK